MRIFHTLSGINKVVDQENYKLQTKISSVQNQSYNVYQSQMLWHTHNNPKVSLFILISLKYIVVAVLTGHYP